MAVDKLTIKHRKSWHCGRAFRTYY